MEEREERAREFAQAQELSSKLMAVMAAVGVKNVQSDTYHKENVSSKEVDIPSENSVMEETDYCNSGTEISKSFGSSASGRSAPTPKRSKPRRSFKTPFLQQNQTSLGFKSAKSTQGTLPRAKRQPLKDLEAGRQNQCKSMPFQSGQKVGDCRMNNDNGLALDEVDVGDVSFEGSDIFTSTAKGRTQVLRSRLPENIYDETTADF